MGTGIARVGQDYAAGVQIGHQNTTVFANGTNVVVLGDKVEGHGVPPHSPPPPMVTASATVFVRGIPVCREGDVAACGHATSGSGNVFVG